MSVQLILALALAGLIHGSLASMECCSQWNSAPGSGRCYLIVNTTRSWDDAKQFCHDIGATLARPRSQEENSWLLEQTGNLSLWMSANDKTLEGTWVWEDGSAIEQFFWGPGEPNDLSGEDCGSVRGLTHMWNDAECTVEIPFACQKCMEGWIERPGFLNKCYYIEKTNVKNWEDAKQFCNGFNATLVKPRSQEENAWLLEQTGNLTLWMSANDQSVEGTWVWEDGSAIEEFFWGPGEPNDLSGEDCGSVRGYNRMWNDAECTVEIPFACEV